MNLANGPTTLSNLFATSALSVPQFQRAFAWEPEPNLREYLDDLQIQPSAADRAYFFGTILLTRDRDSDGPFLTGYAVVDGQQRLTTTCIFAAAAVEKLRGVKEYGELVAEVTDRFIERAGRPKFRTIAEDNAFFERFILGSENPDDPQIETPSQHRLWNAKRYFRERLASLEAQAVQFLLRVVHQSLVLIFAVDTNAEATQIFELQNDRGKRLTDLEALKSYLMHGLYLHAGPKVESDLRFVQDNFAALYRSAEKIEGLYDPPSEDDLLRYHCIAFEPWITLDDESAGWRRPKQLVRAILENADLRAGRSESDWIREFSCRVRDSFSCALHLLMLRDRTDGGRTAERLGGMFVIGRVAPFWPLLLKCWKYDGASGYENLENVVREMERFAFRAVISGKRAGVGDGELRRYAREFTGDFDRLVTALAEMREWWDIPRLFRAGLGDKDFFFQARVATYLLWRYENSLREQRGQQFAKLPWTDVVKPASAAQRFAKDHIEPKDDANPALKKLVKWNEADPDEHERPFSEVFLHRLGNLVLDTVSAGAAKGSKTFSDRVEYYTEKSTLLSQGELVRVFAGSGEGGKKTWDCDSIRMRQKRLVEFAIESL